MGTHIPRGIAALTRAGIAFVFLTGVATPGALAQSAFWNTGATSGGSWGTSTNWQGGTVPSGSGNAAAFVLDFTSGASVTLDGDRTIGIILSTSANPWSLDAGTGGTLTVGSINVTGGPLTVSTALAGTDFVKDGSGTLTLSNNPSATYSGNINIKGGTLKLVGNVNFSINGNLVHVASGATLDTTFLTGGNRFGGDPESRTAVNNGDVLTGTGTVNGGLNVKSGGTVYAGDNGVGVLTILNKGDFSAGSNLKVKLGTNNVGASNTSNRIDFEKSLTLAAGVNLPIDGSGMTFIPGQTYDYVIATSGISSFDLGAVNFQPTNFDPSVNASASDFSLIADGGNLKLRFSPVPEPASVLAVCFGAAAAICVLRRRTTASLPRPAAS